MPIRLPSLQVKNYRQIRSLEIAQLGQVNLVVGGNNAGKSTLLEAIRLLASRGAASVVAEILALHGEYQMPLGSDSTGDWRPERAIGNLFSGRTFPVSDGEAICVGDLADSLSLRLEHVLLREELDELDAEGQKMMVSRSHRVLKKDLETLGADVDVFEAIETTLIDGKDLLGVNKKESVTRLADFFTHRRLSARFRIEEIAPPIPTSFVQARFAPKDSLAEAWDEVVLTAGENDALTALRLIEPTTQGVAFVQQFRPGSVRLNQLRPDNLMRMERSDERFAVIRLKGSSTPVPLQSMGDGMTRVLQLTLAALRARDGFLLIDEIENGLHYSIQENVWRLIFRLARANGTQVFATTHSMDCVRAFEKVSAEDELDGKLLHMERNEETGDAEVSAVSENELSHLVDAGIEVR